jgi:hypothetical protein
MERDPNEDADANPIVTECIEDALAPYRGILSAEILADFALTLELFLTTHPVAAPMVARLRPRPVPAESVEVDRSGAPAVAEAQKPSGTEAGRR